LASIHGTLGGHWQRLNGKGMYVAKGVSYGDIEVACGYNDFVTIKKCVGRHGGGKL